MVKDQLETASLDFRVPDSTRQKVGPRTGIRLFCFFVDAWLEQLLLLATSSSLLGTLYFD